MQNIYLWTKGVIENILKAKLARGLHFDLIDIIELKLDL